MKKLSKKIYVLLMVFCSIFMCNTAQVYAASGSSSLAVSSSSVNIGDTVTVTMRVSADVYASFRMSLNYSSDILEYTGTNKSGDCNGGGGALAILSEVEAGSTYSINFTFRAIAPGDASVSASMVEALAMETAEGISISGSGARITVNNAATENTNSNTEAGGESDGTSGEKEEEKNLSADNSLHVLKVSPGTLSPEFKYSTTKYTCNVASDVTSVVVDARTSHAKATVESVTGNENLQPGENTVKILVKAENGTLATYVITVIRGGVDESEETEENTEEGNVVAGESILVNGIAYKICATLPEETLPEEFQKTTTKYGEQEVEVYTFSPGNLQLFYLEPYKSTEDAEGQDESEKLKGGFFFLDPTTKEFFPYINVTVGEKYVVLLPSSNVTEVPRGCEELSVMIGTETIGGFQFTNELSGEFFLVYGMDKTGAKSLYQYDTIDKSLQRFHAVQYEAEQEEEVVEVQAEEQESEKTQVVEKKEKSSSKIPKIILVCVVVLVLGGIVAGVIILWLKEKGEWDRDKEEDDYIDFDDED